MLIESARLHRKRKLHLRRSAKPALNVTERTF